MLNTFDKILGRLEDAGLFAAAHKCLLFDTGISWERIGEYAPPADGGSVDAIFQGFTWTAGGTV